jgi:RNA polymerase sigma factor (TIGR02999 family)
MSDVTRILDAIEQGDAEAADALLPLVYKELRRLAAYKLGQEAPGQTLDATALVHEAYLKLVGTQAARRWQDRGRFFAAAAEAMRRILVDKARRKRSDKGGGKLVRRDVEPSQLVAPAVADDVVAVDDALDGLAAADPQAAELVKLRYFAGLPIPEAADVLGISSRSADRLWVYARTWLHEALHPEAS